MLLMTTGANWRLSVPAFHFVKMARMYIGFDIALVALGANINDLLFVLCFRHDLLLRFEMGVMAGCADRIVAIVFLIFLVVIALFILSGLRWMTTFTDNLHAQFFLSIVGPMALFAVGNILLPLALEHFVEILHPGGTHDFVARFALDRLVLVEVRHVFKICAVLFVAVNTGYRLVH